MRAAVIFGLGSYERDLRLFQRDSPATWQTGLPGNSSDADAILIFGGDGTIHRHLGQLIKLHLPVLVVPCGSGNDFARALGLFRTSDSLAAWRKFASGGNNFRAIDLGIVEAQDSPTSQQHYFCCIGGVGLDGEVARRANRLPPWLRAHGGYAASLLPAMFRFAPLTMKVSVPGDDSAELVTRSEKPTILAAFANTSAYGGGMKIAPRARLDDGQLDVCILSDINKFKLFCLFPTIYFGRHLSVPEIEYFQTSSLRIETADPVAVYADGEYVCRTPIAVGVLPKALSVITL
jgi:diacylglycerol kinase (ATP)